MYVYIFKSILINPDYILFSFLEHDKPLSNDFQTWITWKLTCTWRSDLHVLISEGVPWVCYRFTNHLT